MKKTIWILVIIIIVGAFFAFNNKNKNSEVRIGAVLPMTGWGAYWGEGEIKGIELAKDEIAKAGGKVSVIVEDGATDGKQSANAAQKLISIDKVDGLFTEFTAPTSSISPIVTAAKIPFLYDAFIKSPLVSNPYAFKMYFDIEKECKVATDYLKRKGYKKIGALLLNLDMNAECKKGIDESLSGTNVQYISYDFNVDTVDFRTFITKMKADKIDSIINVAYEDNAFAFFKQRAEQKLNIPVFVAGDRPDNFNEKITKGLPSDILEGVITYDQSIRPEFVSKIKTKYPDINDKDILSAAYGYDETMYIYNGITACQKSDIDCVTKFIASSKSLNLALDANGFGDDRVIAINPIYYVFTKGEFKEIDVNTY